MSRAIDHLIVSLSSGAHGIVTRSSLEASGVSRASINRRVGELLTVVVPGVYAVGPVAGHGFLAAAVAAEARAAGADLTAGHLLKLPVRPAVGTAIVVPESTRRTFPQPISARRTRHLPDADITVIDGLRVTTVERTICDLSIVVSARQLQRLIEWSISHRRMSAGSFRACAISFCRRGRRGSARIRMLRHELLDGKAIPASELERRGIALLDRGGLDAFRVHFSPPWRLGMRGVVDVAWVDQRLILELDGRRWHAVTEAQEDDRRRDRLAAEHGWLVVRATWDEVVHRPDSLKADLLSLLAQRRRTAESKPQN